MDEKIRCNQANAMLHKAVVENHKREMANLPSKEELENMYPELASKETFHEKLTALLNESEDL